jgi:autotransporter-associated beta strand protein
MRAGISYARPVQPVNLTNTDTMKTNPGFGTSLKYLLPLFALLPLQAFGQLWTGGSRVSSNWSDSANWGGTSIAPDNALFFGGTAGLNNTNDTASGTPYSSITFNPGAGSFVLNGNLLAIANGITNNSLVPQTINLGISFSNSITLNGAGSALNILGGLTNAVSAPVATTITLAGTGTLGNLFTYNYYPLGTNIFAITNNANWTIVNNTPLNQNGGPVVFQIDSGTLSYGTPSSAPFFESDNQNGPPLDNEIAAVPGAAGVLNVINGELALSPDLDMAVAANSTATVNVDSTLIASNLDTALGADSTAIINLNSGSLIVGIKFLGASGNNPGEVSQINADYGSLSISNGSGPLCIANCGTGSLTISNAAVKCGTLDISGNANGNTFSSAGTVYLDGGTLTVNNVTNASSNAQAGGNPTATFYFNGGTLAAKSGPERTFFQGSRVAPVIPITAIVQAGGAIVDVNPNNGFLDPVTIAEPLQHDPALGSARDGGLTKVDIGDLVLAGTNTYNGNTIISSGALMLSGSASIANTPEIVIAGAANLNFAAKFDVSQLSSPFVLGSGQVLSNTAPTAIIAGDFNAAQGILSLTYSPGVESLVLSNSTFTLASSTVLKINNTGAPLGTGIYTLITTNLFFGTIGSNGMVTGTAPSSFTINGGGIAPGKTASLQINNDQLQLVVAPGPRITGVSLHGPTLTLTGTNGMARGQYVLLESTNIALPLSQWIPVLTNNFDNKGDLNLSTNIVNPNNPMEFYLLSP